MDGQQPQGKGLVTSQSPPQAESNQIHATPLDTLTDFLAKVDEWPTRLRKIIRARLQAFGHTGEVAHPPQPILFDPLEDEVHSLLMSASALEDVWRFLLVRLKNGHCPDFVCFSVLDFHTSEQEPFIRVRFLDGSGLPRSSRSDASLPMIALSDIDNHLVHAYQRQDTTFSPDLNRLGEELLAFLPKRTLVMNPAETDDESVSVMPLVDTAFNIFSLPFVAGGKTIALLTLGFQDMDAFSQAKLSYVYGIRDSIAQLIWNLILQERAEQKTQVDNLTGLYSYTCFQDALDRELARATNQCQSVSVMVIDIDRFQDINRELGHAAGDDAIRHVAFTIRRLIRGMDTVARYGGDEIVVLLPETGPLEAPQTAQRFIEGLQANRPEHLSTLSVSIGHASYPDDTRTRGKLLKLAEKALHMARFQQGNTAGERAALLGFSTSLAVSDMGAMTERTVVEAFASQVARKYQNIHVPSVYQELLDQLGKRQQIEQECKSDILTKPDDLMLETIRSLEGALDAKDRYTRGHSQAVANYAVALAHALGMSPSEVEEIRAAGFLHDIGKIGIPENILRKQGPLNEKEWEIMKQHAVIGAQQILHPVPVLRPLIPAVECHHENWDGSGHPHGYKGEKIPVGARIIAIVDAFHALTSDRPYRKALPLAKAKEILDANSGRSWDPGLLGIFFNMLDQASTKRAGGEASSNLIQP